MLLLRLDIDCGPYPELLTLLYFFIPDLDEALLDSILMVTPPPDGLFGVTGFASFLVRGESLNMAFGKPPFGVTENLGGSLVIFFLLIVGVFTLVFYGKVKLFLPPEVATWELVRVSDF